MAKSAQILLLLLVAVAVQSYGGRRYLRGRSHGRSRNPYDYYHRRHGDAEHPRETKHYPNRNHLRNQQNPGDLPEGRSRLRYPAVPDDRPLAGFNPHHEGLESTSTTELPPSVDPVPDNNSSPSDDGNPNSGESLSNSGVDLTGAVNNDKPDDVANVIENGKTPDLEEPDHIGDNIDGDEPSLGDNPDGTINVNGMSPTGSNEQPDGDGSINGLSAGGDEHKTLIGDLDNNLNGNINGNLDGNLNGYVDSNLDGNVDGNVSGDINGNLPNINLDKPTGSINVNGLETGENDGPSSIKSQKGDHDDGYLKNDGMLPEDKDKAGRDGKNMNNNELSPNGNDGNINLNGLSPGNDNNEPEDGRDKVNGNGLLLNGNGDNSGHGSISVSGLSPGGDNSKPDYNDININGLSPGGDDADGYGNNEHGGLPSDDLGEGSIGANENLPDITGHIDHDGLLEPKPEPSKHLIDHGGLEPDIKPDLSGHIDPPFKQPVPIPEVSGHIGLDIDHPPNYPTFSGDDIIPNPSDHMTPTQMPDADGRPDYIPSIEIPDQVDNKVNGKNNTMMIPVMLPGGGNGVLGNTLGNIPSYILVMINGQPTLIQNPGGLGVGGGNAGSLDLSNLILGNNGLSIGGNNGGAMLPSWLNLEGLGGNGGVNIGGGGIGILPNMQPIWIGSQMPNFGRGGATGGSFIIPNNEPVQPAPVPFPIPMPMPPPRSIYPIPQPIPMPGPDFNVNTYPGLNVNFTHMPLTPNQGSYLDWNILLDLLANIDSRLPRPQPPQPTTLPQPKEPSPSPQPSYPSYPYPQYPYPYPPLYPYPPYPYPPNYRYPNNKPTNQGKNVPDIEEERDTANRPEPQPQPYPDIPIIPSPGPQPEPIPNIPKVPRPEPQPGPRPEPQPEPRPEPQPEPRPEPQPEPRPEPQPEPRPEPQPGPRPEPQPEPRPEPQREPRPEPQPEPRPEPQPEPRPEPQPEPRPEPQPEPRPEPQPEPRPEPQPEPRPEPQTTPRPEPQPERLPEPQRDPRPEPQPEPRPEPQPEPLPEPQPEPRPEPQLEPRPEPQPEPRPEPRPVPLEPHKDIPRVPHPDGSLEPRPEPRPEYHLEHPDHHHHDRPVINLPDIHITLPKPTHIGKPKPGQTGLDSGLIDIVNVLMKFPDEKSDPPKNIGPLIKLLLAILKPGDKNPALIPNLNEDNKGQPDLGNLSHLLLHLLDGRKEPNLNVLVEPGMEEGTRASLIMLLQLLANNLGGSGSYPSMGYYQPENPLLYFLGHFPCDHPNIQALSGMQSNSNLWQMLANMYGHNYGQELRLERSAEETDDKPTEAEQGTETN